MWHAFQNSEIWNRCPSLCWLHWDSGNCLHSLIWIHCTQTLQIGKGHSSKLCSTGIVHRRPSHELCQQQTQWSHVFFFHIVFVISISNENALFCFHAAFAILIWTELKECCLNPLPIQPRSVDIFVWSHHRIAIDKLHLSSHMIKWFDGIKLMIAFDNIIMIAFDDTLRSHSMHSMIHYDRIRWFTWSTHSWWSHCLNFGSYDRIVWVKHLMTFDAVSLVSANDFDRIWLFDRIKIWCQHIMDYLTWSNHLMAYFESKDLTL